MIRFFEDFDEIDLDRGKPKARDEDTEENSEILENF